MSISFLIHFWLWERDIGYKKRNGKMTLEFELEKMESPISIGQIRDSPQVVLNEVCDFMAKE